jgi:uncharacterized SAM-binding protein YcdF (DUF218 family)
MSFYLAKIVWLVATPSNLFTLALLTGLVLTAAGLARAGRRLVIFGGGALLVGGLSPLANVVLGPLESRFPEWNSGLGQAPHGIVILGGAVDADVSSRRGHPLELNEAGDRILALIELARRFPDARLVSSGGAGTLIGSAATEADEIKKKIARYGVDPARVIVENRSRTTAENATETRALVGPKPGERWLIVTSAWHMPRAIGVFRRAGFEAEAYPVDYRTSGPDSVLRPFGEASSGLRRLDISTREWVGLIGYRLAGRTDALFPAP